jgi:hypothetical protein
VDMSHEEYLECFRKLQRHMMALKHPRGPDADTDAGTDAGTDMQQGAGDPPRRPQPMLQGRGGVGVGVGVSVGGAASTGLFGPVPPWGGGHVRAGVPSQSMGGWGAGNYSLIPGMGMHPMMMNPMLMTYPYTAPWWNAPF